MKREYSFHVNGFETQAVYEDENIENLFLPLLKKWTDLKKEKGDRVLIFLSAPPGVGKTTVSQFLQYLSEQREELDEIQAIGLDGFHFHQAYILSHTAVIDGEAVPMKDVKGCPETFDIDKLRVKLKELVKGDVKWPIYDRNLHDVVEDAVTVTKDIVLLEGNWLLSTEGPWKEIAASCDDSIFIQADEELLRERLIQRKIKGGLSKAAAESYYENSDRKNVNRLLRNHHPGNTNLRMQQDGSYIFAKEGDK